jgi:hypothetical protein
MSTLTVRPWLAAFLFVVGVPAVTAAPAKMDHTALAAEIDRHIEARLAEKGVQPAALADDAEFFRRVFLDLNGRIPPVRQIRDFLDDSRPDKRRLWIELLMHGRDNREWYIDHFTDYWQGVLMSRATAGFQPTFGPWVRKQVAENIPYDRMIRELLDGPPAEAFYRSQDNQPEKIAAQVSRLVLGIKLECAQCHDDRSGGRWTQTQFWQLAAFFTPDARTGNGSAEIKIPDPGRTETVSATFLDGRKPELNKGRSAVTPLGHWITDPANPYFARAVANRLWAYFFGIGLVDPIDAAGPNNLPSHPQLLDLLASQLVAHDFDLQYLIRAITWSRAYQRSSVGTTAVDPRLFARMQVRAMSAAQMFDSLAQATGFGTASPSQPNLARQRGDFLSRFPREDGTGAQDTSILQALYLMNGGLIADATSPDKSKTLKVITSAGPSVATDVRIRELFLATLSREPDTDELKRLTKYVEDGGAARNRTKALADVFWVCINSGEFFLNH